MFRAASKYFDFYEEILFVGIGSGVIAKLFAAIDKKIIFIDINSEFCRRFQGQAREPQKVRCVDFCTYLQDEGDTQGERLIVSCLPMRGAFRSDNLRKTMLEQVAKGSTVVFFSYLPYPPWGVRDASCQRIGVHIAREDAVLWNIPPAFVYSLGKRTATATTGERSASAEQAQ